MIRQQRKIVVHKEIIYWLFVDEIKIQFMLIFIFIDVNISIINIALQEVLIYERQKISTSYVGTRIIAFLQER